MVQGSRIGVVVVAFKSASTIVRCLEGCTRGTEVVEVVVVDNSSDGATAKRVATFARRASPVVTYIATEDNLGFAAGCGAGVQLLQRAEVVFFVNPDAFLTRTLGELVNCSDPDAAIVSARLLSLRDPRALNARQRATLVREFAKVVAGSSFYSRRYFRQLQGRSVRQELWVDQVDGALLGINLKDLHRLGGFDERFELYYEDVDLCRRATQFGRIAFITEVWGYHVGGASSSQLGREPYLAARVSRVRYLLKYKSPSHSIRVIIGALALTEFITRSLTFQSEGIAVRWEAVRLAWRELQLHGSVRVLGRSEGL